MSATDVGEIRARITLEMDAFRRQMDEARQRIRDLENQGRKSAEGMRDLSSALTGIGAGAGLKRLTSEMLAAVDASTKLYNAFMGLNAVAKGFAVSTKDAQQAAQDLADRGFLTLTQAAEAYKTALSTGLDLEETTKLINAMADAAAYNRQSHYDMGGAILASLQGIKNGNSELTDAVGITKNLSVMQAEYAKSIGTTAGRLTEAEKIQAAYNGFLSESALYAGNADQAMEGFVGTQAQFAQATNEASVAIGEALTPVLQGLLETLTPAIIALADFADDNRSLVAGLASGTTSVLALVAACALVPPALNAIGVAIKALGAAAGPVGLAITAIGLLVGAFGALTAAKAADKKVTEEMLSAQKELNELLDKSAIDRTASDIETLTQKTKELNQILKERAELQKRLNEIQEAEKNGTWMPEMFAESMEISEALGEIDEKLETLGFSGVEQATVKMAEMNAVIKQGTVGLTDQEKAEASALATKKQTLKEMSAYATEFKKLNSAQELDASQKRRLVEITEKLIAQYPELNAQQGEDGRIRADNIDAIITQIDTDKRFTDEAGKQITARINNMKTEAAAQAQSVQAQIDNYTKLLTAMGKVSGARAATFAESVAQGQQRMNGETPSVGSLVFGGYVTSQMEKERDEALKQQQKYADTVRELEKLAAEVTNGPTSFNSDIIAGDSAKESKKTGKTAAELAAEARKAAYEADLKTVQYVSEFYNLTADAQIKKYEDLKKKHAAYLKESVDDARSLTLQLKSLAAESDQDRYDASAEYIDAEVRRMENAGKSEREIANQRTYLWTKLRDKYAKDSEFYKAADEQVYQARKALTAATVSQEEALYKSRKELAEKYADDIEDMLDAELDAIKKAKDADLDAIEKRKQAALDDYDARIDAIQRLRDANKQLNEDADYETQLAEKQARLAVLQSAVGPEGIEERDALNKEIARMQLEHERDLADRALETQQEALEDEKTAAEKAYDDELTRTESQYDALTEALETHAGDVKAIEAGIAAFRVTEAANANTQILTELDAFVAAYSAKMAALTANQEALDLATYNSNKDAWTAAKTAGNTAAMTLLEAENQAIREKYGITSDTGKLQSFADGGIIAGLRGSATLVQAHAGEIVLNPQQQSALWQMIAAPKAVSAEPAAPVHVTNEIDMSVNDVTLADSLDVSALYDERARAAQRLQSMGVKDAL